MGTNYGSATAKCPFYLGEDKRSVSCEGICGGNKTTISFDTSEKKRTQKVLFCDSSYEYCELYLRLIKKY